MKSRIQREENQLLLKKFCSVLDRTMQTERNRRGFEEHFIERQHLKLKDLKTKARDGGSGLCGIWRDGGFRNPFGEPWIWWSLAVGTDQMKDAETRLLEKTFPDRTEGEEPEQQNFLWRFATSPAFKETSRLGWYRFTFPLQEVLTAYSEQFCSGARPIMRTYRTVLYSQEVMHVVLIHSPANERKFSQYPPLSDAPDAVCIYRDGHFLWRPEAMCETHGYELINRQGSNHLEALSASPPQFYVWDHVAVALHVGQNQVMKFSADQLRARLGFCQLDTVNYSAASEKPEDFEDAKAAVRRLWPGWSGPLQMEPSLKQSLTVSDIQLVLVGWDGVGKSSSGNTILGRNGFRTRAAVSPPSGRSQCCLQRANVFGREVTVISTPALPETSDPEVRNEIFRCINRSTPAPHAILLVVRLGLLTTHVEETVKHMEKMFGGNVWRRTMILLTHQNQAEPEIQSQLKEIENQLKLLFRKVRVCEAECPVMEWSPVQGRLCLSPSDRWRQTSRTAEAETEVWLQKKDVAVRIH
ncbi:uncharacterized protein LOC129370681 [Poeciliopsis prolifica]|uniref:uncharacterized protein LOC129370681 n=1 Tax=Poeciliopsis prolifica TaxID=188132 RepID=UPI00241330EA|nr:uncharacterized protein LOC129370681 [Poeciliopsis prolifica]